MKISLPIDAHISSILEAFETNPSLILSASPGAGKTTRLPPALLERTKRKILVLEPRRIAAIGAAARIAEENAWTIGHEVGYQVRFENRSSRETRIIFLTEALLLRKMLRDPSLEDVDCVVLDEFHERSLHIDLALGALFELQQLSRTDLKIVVMSATLDAQPLSKYLGSAPIFSVPGKLYPLKIVYEEKPQLCRVGPEFSERIRKLVQKAFAENREGDVLCFLPGRGEIERLRNDLETWADSSGTKIFPLHGQLEIGEQRAAILPSQKYRKLILATNVAESSLTVEGVRVVVDSGLQRISQLDPRTGFPSLDLVRISMASATQRAGRSARQGPGVVYRAWAKQDELSIKDFDPPEVHRTDLAECLLLLSALGVKNHQSFSWFEAPGARNLQQARDFLLALGAMNSEGELTKLGNSLREMPIHPRLGKMLLVGSKMGIPNLTSELAALLSEPSGKGSSRMSDWENDILSRWYEWRRSRGSPRFRNLDRAAKQLQEMLSGSGTDICSPESAFEQFLPELFLEVFPDRICKRRRAGEPQAKMSGGRGVRLHPDSSVRSSEYFIAIELTEGRDLSETLVFQAVGIPSEVFEKVFGEQAEFVKKMEWDEEKKRFYVLECREWRSLSMGGEHKRPASLEEIEGRLAELAAARFTWISNDNAELACWLARIRLLHKFDSRWPEFSPEQLSVALQQACFGETSLDALRKKDLVPFFENQVAAEQRDALNRFCPPFWTVPTGNRIPIEYTGELGPTAQVRLQELFGLKDAPSVAGNPLTIQLLAPNYRPVQVTRDLASFWANGYPEVRKELRARYPKHSWPENPLTAVPQSKGRPRQ